MAMGRQWGDQIQFAEYSETIHIKYGSYFGVE